MLKRRSRLVCFLVAVQFVLFQFASVGWAKRVEKFDPKKVSVAVLPKPSAGKERLLIEETAEKIRNDLKKIPYFTVVDPATVQSLVNYHADYIRKGAVVSDAERHLGLAKTHWFDREYREAEATADRAISQLANQPDKGALLVDALLTKALIYQETNRYQESKAVFEKVLSVNPAMTMEGLPVVGRSRHLFNETRQEFLQRHTGGVEIKTDPPAADVYLNGIRKGVSPLTLASLPEGSYLMTLEGSHYETVHEPVYVTANTTQFINRKLQWSGTGTGLNNYGLPYRSDEELQDEIKLASQIGETLKVDKVVLVTSQKKKGEDLLVVRTIDTALKSAYNPIGMPMDEFLKNKEASVQKIAGDLDDQAKLRVLDNPAKHLQPDMGDVRVLRREIPFYKKPLFLSLMGAVVGGAIGATAGILLTRDSDSGSSEGEGGIDIEFE